MFSDIEICNIALGRIGVSQKIESLTELSNEAAVLSTFIEQVREAVLRDFPWPFATKFLSLALVESDPNDDWDYAYRYPIDCVKLRRIVNTAGRTDATRIPFRLAHDAQGRLIWTDEENATVEYTARVTDPLLYDGIFASVFAWRLATEAATALTGGDAYKMGKRALEMYYLELEKARNEALNEEQSDEPPDSEFIRVR